MVKQLNLSLDDTDFEKLEKKKGDRTWKEFIMLLLNWEEEPELKGGIN
jgi:hypothetical protein